jgi:HEAT repeat protein
VRHRRRSPLAQWLMLVAISLPLGEFETAMADDDSAAWIAKLDKSQPKSVRLMAIEKLKTASGGAKDVPERLAALAATAKDADAEIRAEAVRALGIIGYTNERPLPMTLVEALADPVADVQDAAGDYVGAFKYFEEGAVLKLLPLTRHASDRVRDRALMLLADAGRKDPRAVVALMRAATDDKDLVVRGNASAMSFRVTGSLNQRLRQMAQLEEDRRGVDYQATDEEGRRRATTVGLQGIGAAMQIKEFIEQRTDDTAPLLTQLTKDRAPHVRRFAARFLGLLGRARMEAREKYELRKTLVKLSTDTDAKVREEAEIALANLEKPLEP